MFPNLIKRHSLAVVSVGLGLGLMNIGKPALAAEDVALVSGAFRRSIPVREVAHRAEAREAIGMLGSLLEFSGQPPE